MGLFRGKKTSKVDQVKAEHEAFVGRLAENQSAAEIILRKVAIDAQQRAAELRAHAQVHNDAADELTEKFL